MSLWIKICGITRREDARLALELGADAIGMVMHRRSPRGCDVETARDIVSALPKRSVTVGVWFDEPADDIAPIAEQIGCAAVQTYDIDAAVNLAARDFSVIPALGLLDEKNENKIDAEIVRLQEAGIKRIILDFARSSSRTNPPESRLGKGGGNNSAAARREFVERFEHATRMLASAEGISCIVAGGLTWESVAEALSACRPAGVDVSSGVESLPGVKDPERLRRFMAEVRGWEAKAISVRTAGGSYPRP